MTSFKIKYPQYSINKFKKIYKLKAPKNTS